MSLGIKQLFSMKLMPVMTKENLKSSLASALIALSIFLTIIFSTGMSDFLFEQNFRHFKWPNYVDVRQQVIRELMGQPSDFLYLNDWASFQPLVKPSCQNNRLTRKRSILVVVKSAPDRLRQRQAIRTTWGSVRQIEAFRVRTIFVVGRENPNAHVQSIFEEAKEFGDLLIGDFVDHYRNNTLKFIHSIGLAKEYCGAEQPIPYLLLLDDDYLLSFKNLAVEAQRHAPNERLYMGWRFVSSPFRLFFWKHRVALDEYPFAAYPPYISAGAVFMTGQTIKEFYLAIQYVKLYKFDDIYAGILSYFLGITAQHNENFPYYRVKTANEEEEVRLWKSGIAMHDYRPYELLEIYPRMAAVQNQNSTNT